MKKNYKYIFGLLFVSALFSCKKQLDINDNPNAPTEATPSRVLPQAIVATANNLSQFNLYGGQVVGYFANGGGVSGWGSIISYDYQTSEFNGLWSSTYDILTDVKYVLDKSEGDATLKEFNAAAKVLKAYNFELLVDTYNDVPYTDANKGLDNIQPKYDKATDIYKNLADLCDQAIASFKTATVGTPAFIAADPMFGGNPTKWAKLANTIKLKLILKGRGKVAFSNTTFDPVGFITDPIITDNSALTDALVQPGYTQIEGKQNATYNRWAYQASGAVVSAASNFALTPYILGFYDGSKILDAKRRAVTFGTSATNQLGYQLSDAGRGASPSSWYVKGIGILKGPDAASPIMLAAESYFLQAEANLVGLLPGTPDANFKAGMVAAFKYLYLNSSGALTAGMSPSADVDAYISNATNLTKPNVNFSLATTDAQKLEAIITQKYIAFNMFFGHEAWNEFRRTGYPVTLTNGNPSQTFVSIVSQATTANKLPTRILYPLSEFKYNESNVPAVDKFSSKIFWAK